MISRTPRYTRTDTFFPCTTRFRSRRVIFRDATVRWVDQSRGAPALVLRHVTLTLGSHDRTHDFSLSAVPPDGLGKRLDLRGIFSAPSARSEEHTSELQSLMRISYAVFCLKKKK